MKLSVLSLSLSVVVLCQCGKKSEPVGSQVTGDPTAAVESAEAGSRPKLEDVIRGVWISHHPEALDGVEKVQLDFRNEREVTMIVFNPGENEPSNGTYQVSGDELKIAFEGQPDEIATSYDGTTLTVIDSANDQKVDFKKF